MQASILNIKSIPVEHHLLSDYHVQDPVLSVIQANLVQYSCVFGALVISIDQVKHTNHYYKADYEKLCKSFTRA